jgi:hypothetical protein
VSIDDERPDERTYIPLNELDLGGPNGDDINAISMHVYRLYEELKRLRGVSGLRCNTPICVPRELADLVTHSRAVRAMAAASQSSGSSSAGVALVKSGNVPIHVGDLLVCTANGEAAPASSVLGQPIGVALDVPDAAGMVRVMFTVPVTGSVHKAR